MRGIIADTGPLYAAYDSSDFYHRQAHQEIATAAQQNLPVLLPYLVFAECHNLLLKRFDPMVGLRFVQEMVAGTTLLNPVGEDYETAIQSLQRYSDQTITLCDATTAALSTRLGLPVWTYDFHFDVMGSVIWR